MKCPICGADANHVAARVKGTNEPIYACRLSRVVFDADFDANGKYELEPVLKK